VCRITAYLPSGRTPGRTRPLPSTGAPDRHRQLDLQLCCHIDNQVADEWQPARRDAVPGQPSEQFRKGFIHGIGDAVHGDDHPYSGVVLRGAHLDLRLVVHVAASVSTGMPNVTAGRPGTHRWRHGRDGPALPRQSACDLSGGCGPRRAASCTSSAIWTRPSPRRNTSSGRSLGSSGTAESPTISAAMGAGFHGGSVTFCHEVEVSERPRCVSCGPVPACRSREVEYDRVTVNMAGEFGLDSPISHIHRELRLGS